MWKSKKGAFSLSDGPDLILTIVLIAAIGVAGFLILGGLGTATSDANATSAIANVTLGLSGFFSYFPTILTIAAVSVLLGLIVVGFVVARNKGMM